MCSMNIGVYSTTFVVCVNSVVTLLVLIVTGPLTSHGELHYETFSVRFEAGRSLTVKSGYYADWVITERSAPVARQCNHCHNYCYQGYQHTAESCASSCQCIARVDKGMCKFATIHFFTVIPTLSR